MESNILREQCIKDYSVFCELMQDDGWFDPVHKKLCQWVQAQIEDAESRDEDVKINVVMPRGSLKSTIVTKYLPVWLTLKDPNFRTLIASGTQPNAARKVAEIRGLFEVQEDFKALFPELLPDRNCKWTDTAAEIKRTKAWGESTFEAAGLKTKLVGRHYNLLLEDDTCAPAESDNKMDITIPSRETIEGAIGWHKEATPLLVPKGRRMRVVVTTRWADGDLVDYIREFERYNFFDIPAMDETEENCYFTMFYDKAKLADIKVQVGPYMYSCLYLNKPMDSSLRVFKKDWFQYKASQDIDLENATTYFRTIAVDPAISERDESCETAITEILHVQEGNRSFQYWVKDIHAHLSPSETVNKTIDLAVKNIDEIKCIIIEANAYQAALKYAFRDELARRGLSIDILPVISRTSKNIRIEGMQPYFAAKKVFFCEGLTNQVESQLLQFPHGKLVDVIDSFALHQRAIKGDKWAKPVKQGKKELDPHSGEAILAELRVRHKKKGGMGVLSESMVSSPMEDCMSTGLGVTVDTGLLMRRW